MNIFLNLSALKNATESGKVPFRRGAFHKVKLFHRSS